MSWAYTEHGLDISHSFSTKLKHMKLLKTILSTKNSIVLYS